MLNLISGIFVILHGLVHLWYFTLGQRLVPFEPAMGWSGRSWIFTGLIGDTATRAIASVLFILAAAGFVASGIGVIARLDWWQTAIIASALLSAATFILFWDGSLQTPIQKGLLGLIINIVILIAVFSRS